MLKPKRIRISTYWGDSRNDAVVYRYVHFLSEPFTWYRLHRHGSFDRNLLGTGHGFQVIEWVGK